MNIAIIDYGMGNIKSIIGALKFIGVDNVCLSDDYETLKSADKLILPGVGSFSMAMKNIQKKSLDQLLPELVLNDKKPILGICLGMQLMGTSSTENGLSMGLDFVKGEVTQFNCKGVKIPHVGFNQIAVNNHLKLYHEMSHEVDFYFTHSFKMSSDSNINQCVCHYGEDFIASYEVDNIAGVQFHPELSQSNGLKLIKNFIEHF